DVYKRQEQYQDINTINRYEIAKNKGEDLEAFLENEKEASRDNARTPMQWDTTKYSGFSTKTPWISLNTNYTTGINVATQEADPNSVLHYFRKATDLRKSHPGLIYGDYQLIDAKNEKIYAYTRTYEDRQYLILLSFSDTNATVRLSGLNISKQQLLLANTIGNTEILSEICHLDPYEARVYEITN
ncbi:MAG: alpha-glucosidase C-terminal domain-containing protein, partial [Flavobacteriia bacterium]|nr:alpha-glucosidase C-terminal domain-containing protein [Flavobacteriia bacterium]